MAVVAKDAVTEQTTGSSSDPRATTAETLGDKADDDLSPEEAAWVDSCLVKDDYGEELSDDTLAALSEAFVNALAHPISDSTAFTGQEGTMQVSPSASAVSPATDAAGIDDFDAFVEEPSSPATTTYAAATFGRDGSSPIIGSSDKELPNFADATAQRSGDEPVGSDSPGEQGEDEFSVGGAGEVEPARDVFRVWELEWSDEGDEDDFDLQLKKALKGSLVGEELVAASSPPADGWSRTNVDDEWEVREEATGAGLDDRDLEEIIAGVEDVALGDGPGRLPPPSPG